ncbi:MAG TPA: PQQ-binding-like beta-propeller repeat protein, partial [Gemmataceae bacterium]|nr:PQQ-binding-like beta-propeller repeat protein [Gemmataceae bacterium]
MKRFIAWSTLLSALLTTPAFAENWPLWRGPENNGISSETKLPLQWSETKNVVWKVKMPGKAGATPVIWGDRLFVSSGDGKDNVLLCLDTAGKTLWKRKIGAAGRFKVNTGETNDAANSPSTDGKNVYAFDGSGNLVCFDFDGKEIWRFNAVDRY